MRMRILTLIAVLAIATTAIAAPINYGYGYETSPADSYNLDWYNPATIGGSMCARQAAGAKNGTYGIKGFADGSINASAVDLALGAARDGYMPVDNYVVPTASDNIMVSSWIQLGHENLGTAMIELSYGEDANSHAPVGTGDGYPEALESPINVVAIANARAAGLNGYDQIVIFDGTQWIDTGITYPDLRGAWRTWQMEVAPHANGVQVRVNVNNGAGWSSWVTATGVTKFDHATIRSHRGTNNKSTYYDDLAVTGGDVVPEPSALALLGFGLPLVLYRRRRW